MEAISGKIATDPYVLGSVAETVICHGAEVGRAVSNKISF